MANVFQDLFGGSNTSTQSTAVNLNPLTAQLNPALSSTLNSALQTGAPQYTGQTTPTGTAAQNTSLSNLATAVAPGNPTSSYINNVLSGSYMPGGANGNPFLSATINAANLPIQESANTLLTQANPEAFAGGAGQQVQGTGSSAFANAQNLGVQSAVNAESANATQIANNAYNTGVTQMTAAANLQPQEVNAAINVLQAQLLPTLLQEQGITNGLTAFQDNVTALTSFLQTMTSAANPVVGNNSTSSGTSEGSVAQGIGQLFGGTNNAASNIVSGAGSATTSLSNFLSSLG